MGGAILDGLLSAREPHDPEVLAVVRRADQAAELDSRDGVRAVGAEEAAAQEGGQRGHRTTVPPPGPDAAATRMLPDVPAGCEDGARVGSPAHGAPHERQGRAWPTT